MYHSAKDFQNTIIKMAQTEGGDNEGATVKGVQNDDTPELLQPDEGSGEGSRGEHETMSEGAEKEHADNREGSGGYLENAFKGFQEAARHDGADLSNLLDNFGPKAIVSRATAEAGQKMKLSSVSIGSFADEIGKIAFLRSGLKAVGQAAKASGFPKAGLTAAGQAAKQKKGLLGMLKKAPKAAPKPPSAVGLVPGIRV